MAESTFSLARAAAVLRDAGLAKAVLIRRDGDWRRAGKDDDLAGAAFAGATLDSRAVAGGELFVALRGEKTDGRVHAPAALAAGAGAVLTRPWDGPGPDPLLAAEAAAGAGLLVCPDPTTALQCLAGAWRSLQPAGVIGITGTNGKTTTKDLLAAMLAGAGPVCATAGNLNNDLGLPLTLLGLRPEHRYAVAEMGASAPGDIARLAPLAAPGVGVITNAAPAHLAGFGSLETVVAAKGELLDVLPAGGTAVLNADSPGFAAWAERAPCPVVSWGREAGDHRWSWRPAADPARGELELDGRRYVVPLPGPHNAANLVAALLAARACGVAEKDLDLGFDGFTGSPHRGRVLRRAGVILLDDCYNANPESMVHAARALASLAGEGRRIGVLGLMGELGPDSEDIHRRTGADLRTAGLDIVIAVGGARPLAAGFAAAGGEAETVDDHEAAAARLASLLRRGDRVLLKGSRCAAIERVLNIYLASTPEDPAAGGGN